MKRYYSTINPISDEALAAATRLLERHGAMDVAWMLDLADYPDLPCGHPHDSLRNRPDPSRYAPVDVECGTCGARWKKSRGIKASA